MLRNIGVKMFICLIFWLVAQPVYSEGLENAETPKSEEGSQVSFPDIVEKVKKSIVSIHTLKIAEVNEFDKEGQPKFKYKLRGISSGIIVSPDGYILT